MDDCAFNDFTPIDEYRENARSDSSTVPRLPLSDAFGALLLASLREKSTGSALNIYSYMNNVPLVKIHVCE